jgi:peptidoglycan/LPS O-acetylase OafA/YrhL
MFEAIVLFMCRFLFYIAIGAAFLCTSFILAGLLAYDKSKEAYAYTRLALSIFIGGILVFLALTDPIGIIS